MSIAQGTGAEGSALQKIGVKPAVTTVSSTTQKAETGEKSEEDKKRNERFREQCYLMLNWEHYSRFNIIQEFEENTGPLLTQKPIYSQLGVIEFDRPANFISELFTRGPDADLLFNLDSSKLSMLVPKVRLFKVYTDSKGKEEIFSAELPFDDFMSKGSIESITTNKAGRGDGAGLKSFSWKTIGKMVANKSQLVAEMVLHFQSLEDIFSERAYYAFVDNKTNSVRSVTVRFSDLLIQNQISKEPNDGSRVWDPEYYTIKADVGWAVPQGGFGNFMRKEVVNIVNRTGAQMTLSLYNHEMKIREDGSVDLTIRFNTLGENLASDPKRANILFPSASFEKRRKAVTDQIEKRKKEIEEPFIAKTKTNEEPDPDAKKRLEEALNKDGKLKELREQKENFIQAKKMLSYKKFIDRLFRRRNIWKVQVPVDDLTLGPKLKVTESSETGIESEFEARRQIQKMNALKEAAKGHIPKPLITKEELQHMENIIAKDTIYKNSDEGFIDGIFNFINKHQKDVENTAGGFAAGLAAAPFLGLLAPLVGAGVGLSKGDEIRNAIADAFKEGDEKFEVIYFYLGDLIDIALEGVLNEEADSSDKGSFEKKKLKVVLGPMTFYDYGSIEEQGVADKRAGVVNDKMNIKKKFVGKMSSVNLADIPISLSLFTNWFNEQIVDPGLETMTFKDFADLVITDLVIKAIRSECYEFTPRQQARASYKFITTVKDESRDQRWASNNRRINLNDSIYRGLFAPTNNLRIEPNTEFEHYMIIYGSVESPWDLTGKYEDDKKKGIYHLFFGNERGMVKRINFNREDKPYPRAANMANNFDKKDDEKTKMLREVYHADVEMFGNNLFEVGSMVKIIPSFSKGKSGMVANNGGTDPSAGDRNDKLVDDLGLGGYFQVLEIENKIESGKYETNLTLKWQCPGNGKVDNLDGSAVFVEYAGEPLEDPTNSNRRKEEDLNIAGIELIRQRRKIAKAVPGRLTFEP